MTRILPRFLLVAAAAFTLAACSSFNTAPQERDETRTWSAEKLFLEAKAEQGGRNYTESNKLLEKLEARYPYGKYAQQAILETAYNNYKDEEPLLALAALDRFTKQYPAHPSIDYALYLRGLVFFKDSEGMMSALVEQDMSERDPKAAKDSYLAFQELIARFPDSRYAEDARARMTYLIGALASHELHVAKYYFRRGAYLAAVNRSKSVLEQFGNTKMVEPALGMMVLSYDKLGMADLRDDAKRVLLQNYPDTTVLNGNFLKDREWWAPW
ncbi:outer membrane protein assembly factor BamD [Chitinibacteraceae bacterium HSL-7]